MPRPIYRNVAWTIEFTRAGALNTKGHPARARDIVDSYNAVVAGVGDVDFPLRVYGNTIRVDELIHARSHRAEGSEAATERSVESHDSVVGGVGNVNIAAWSDCDSKDGIEFVGTRSPAAEG